MPNRQLIVVGAGAFAREVVWAAREAHDPWDVLGYLDDNAEIQGSHICDASVLGGIDDWTNYPEASLVVAIGQPRGRRQIVRRMQERGTPRFGTVIHRSVQKSAYVELGEGSIVCAGTILTTQVRLGSHCIVNLNCTIGHDVQLGDFCTLAPLVACSGSVSAGPGVEIGTSAAIRQGLTLGEGAMVGMGSVLTKNVPPNALWVGNPARAVREFPAWTGD